MTPLAFRVLRKAYLNAVTVNTIVRLYDNDQPKILRAWRTIIVAKYVQIPCSFM
jgi:hypothetical protein